MKRASYRGVAAALTALLVTVPVAGLAAQSAPALDRTKAPTPASPQALRVPTWTHEKLSNGAELIVSQKHDLPLVSFTIDFVGGTNQFSSGDKDGVGSFTAAMMSEGTTSRTGDQLSDALDLLGTRVGVSVGGENGEIGFLATKAKFAATLDVLADMMLHSTFPQDALERLRARTLVSLTQAKDQPTSIAANVFPRVVYGSDHPYGWFPTEETVKGITRADIVAFHDRYFQPGRAIISVVGDVEPEMVKRAVEHALAAWPAGGSRPTFTYPAVLAARPTTIYLVDKPKAAQSVFTIGNPGPSRATPDYYAIEVMNMILGGLFQSRLNHNIREEKGFSYGVYSDFAFGRGPGAFSSGGSIVTAKSDSALMEFMKELRGVQGGVRSRMTKWSRGGRR